MSKPTQSKARQESKSPAGQKPELSSVRPASGSSQRAVAGPEATKPHSTSAGGATPRHEQIAVRAYQLWEAQGKPAGTDWLNWFEAERLLRAEVR
ncbi:MAG: DUF2934 domain-containing protein [Isosphaerales bacterium]